MRSESIHHSHVGKVIVPAPQLHIAARPTNESIFGDFTCILKGYPTIYTLKEMQEKVSHAHHINVPREKKCACNLMFCGCLFICALCALYWLLIFNFDYDLQAKKGIIVIVEIAGVINVLIIGMCLFRWCSLTDVSPHVIWKRVAVTECTPLKLIKFDMEHVDITYFEYNIIYGEYPHKLHDPVVTLVKQHKVCNARDLVKITKKNPDKKQNLISYGTIYFHFKGEDDYLLNRWRFEFGKHHASLTAVFMQCNRFNSIFHQHFDNKFRIHPLDLTLKTDYVQQTTTKEKEDNIINILDGFGKGRVMYDDDDDFDDFYHDTHEESLSRSHELVNSIHPNLLGKHRRSVHTPSKKKYNRHPSYTQ